MSIAREKAHIIQEFAKNEQDTGSQTVQIALLTAHIKDLTGHCQTHPKDFSSRRGLLKMVSQRNSFLKYLKRKDVSGYEKLIQKLGLRK